MGKSKRAGCLRKVLKRARCQVKMTPVMRPGRVRKGKVKKRGDKNLLRSAERQARKMRMNWMERNPLRSPPSATTLHTPTLDILIKTLIYQQIITLRLFAMPRLAEMTEVKKERTNKVEPYELPAPMKPF